MNINYPRILIAVMAAMFLTHMPVSAEVTDPSDVYHLSGEIVNVDAKLGVINLKSDMSSDMGEVNEYKINKNDTRVTDPLDKKFLSIDDLQAGQYIIIDVLKGERNKPLKKIVAYPYVAPGLQQVFGNIQLVDGAAGTLLLAERPMSYDIDRKQVSYFVFEPQNIVIMQDPSLQPVQLVLKPGDLISVVYVLKDGQKHAQSITLYTPEVTRTTVSTTTTTTKIR